MSDPTTHSSSLGEADFLRLFLKHEPGLRAFARTLLPDWNAVDEVLQEASVTMWRKLDQLREADGFLPWAKVIVRFKCLSAITLMRRERHLLSDHVLELLADESLDCNEPEQHRIHGALQKCLSQFDDQNRELLLAPYIGSGHVKQMADQCGKSVNSLYKLLGRLRNKLGECIQNQLNSEAGWDG